MSNPEQWFVLLGNPGDGVYSNSISAPPITTTGKLLPTIVKCASQDEAEQMHGVFQSAFTQIDQELKRSSTTFDDLLRLVGVNSTLNSVGGKIYPVYRPRQGIGLITFSHKIDLVPMFLEGNPDRYECRFQKVDTLGKALVFLLARGSREKLRSMGFTWVKYEVEEGPNPVINPSYKAATGSPSGSPQKRAKSGGQSAKSFGTVDALSESLTNLSVGQNDTLLTSLSAVYSSEPLSPGTGSAGAATSTTRFPATIQIFKLSVADKKEVKDAAEALGLSAAATSIPGAATCFLVVGDTLGMAQVVRDGIEANAAATGTAKDLAIVRADDAKSSLEAWVALAA